MIGISTNKFSYQVELTATIHQLWLAKISTSHARLGKLYHSEDRLYKLRIQVIESQSTGYTNSEYRFCYAWYKLYKLEVQHIPCPQYRLYKIWVQVIQTQSIDYTTWSRRYTNSQYRLYKLRVQVIQTQSTGYTNHTIKYFIVYQHILMNSETTKRLKTQFGYII